MPAWWTPIPLRSSFESVLPKPAPNRKPAIRSASSSAVGRARRDPAGAEQAVACSTAAAWVKCTTYTGAWPVVTSSSSVSASGVSAQVKCSGTGRTASATTAVSRPLRRVRSVGERA